MGVSEPPAGGWTWDQFTATAKQLTERARARSAPRGPSVGDEDTVWRTWPLVWQAGGDIIKDGKAAFGGAPGEQAFGVVDRLAQDGSVYVDTKPDSDQTYQLFNNDKIGMVVDRPVAAARLHRGQDRLRRGAAADVRRRAADDLGARHVDAVRQRQAAREGRGRVRAVAQLAGAGRALGGRRGLAAAAQGHRGAGGVEGSYQDKTPGLSVFVAGARRRAHEADRSRPTRRSPSRSGSRSSRCCSSARRPQDALDKAVQGSERGPRRRRLIGGWPSPSSGRPPAPSGCSARRRPPGCGSRPAVVIILGLSLVPMALGAAAELPAQRPGHAEHVDRPAATTRGCSTTRRSAARSSTR